MRPDRLVLNLFQGADLWGRAVRESNPDWTMTWGPEALWGEDVRGWHVPPGVFWGILASPPCQAFSRLRHLNPKAGQRHGNLFPEVERLVTEGQPAWFLVENVPEAPEPAVPGYIVKSIVVNNRWVGGEQNRERRFSLGTRDGRELLIDYVALEPYEYRQAVTGGARAVPARLGGSGKVKRTYFCEGVQHGPGRGPLCSLAEMLVAQGQPPNLLDEAPYTMDAKRQLVGNGVPRDLGLAVARALRRAVESEAKEASG